MLVLSRHEGQDIVLTLEDGRTIEIKLTRIKGLHTATIGITAPPTIQILRRELTSETNEPIRENRE